ncbi:MAG TPA: GNAT family N-acetyltransferase [Longimicrobiaceae bacterium]|nr:GNAT family N-acetyltransferase [Longimicrobiaceae bacterium]
MHKMDRKHTTTGRLYWALGEISYHILHEEPPPGFDCGREEQNAFLYGHAWADLQDRLSTTYLFFIQGRLAAFAAVVMAGLVLGRKERGQIRFKHVGALKLCQLGVDRRFAGKGLGRFIVGFMTAFAWDVGREVACRYVTLDAQPELVGWYEGRGFVRNRTMQAQRIEEAQRFGRTPEQVPVSMRFDLREDRRLRLA